VRPARHFTQLIVWQLSDQIRSEVYELTKQHPLRADLKLRTQLDDAAESVCRNVAEGFGCGNREFAHYLRIARRSLNEVQDELHGALLKGYVTEGDLVAARRLMRRLYPAFSSLIRHLDRHPTGPNARQRELRRPDR
jgi:four helix bundle protein